MFGSERLCQEQFCFWNKFGYLSSFVFPDYSVISKSVDYGRMAEILVQRAEATDEFTRQTAITWVRIVFMG